MRMCGGRRGSGEKEKNNNIYLWGWLVCAGSGCSEGEKNEEE